MTTSNSSSSNGNGLKRPPPASSSLHPQHLRINSIVPSPSASSSKSFSPFTFSPASIHAASSPTLHSPESSNGVEYTPTRSSSQPSTHGSPAHYHSLSSQPQMMQAKISSSDSASLRFSEPRLRAVSTTPASSTTPSSWSSSNRPSLDGRDSRFDDDDALANDKYNKQRRGVDINSVHKSNGSSASMSNGATSLSTIAAMVMVMCLFMLSFSMYWFNVDRSLIPNSMRKMLFTSYRPYDPAYNTVIRDSDWPTQLDDELLQELCASKPGGTIVQGVVCPSGSKGDALEEDGDEEAGASNDVSWVGSEDGSQTLTIEDITIFTVLQPEPEDKPVLNRRGKLIKPAAPHDTTSWLRAIFSWSQRVNSPARIMVLVRRVEDCALLKDLPFEVYCRVVSVCWPSDAVIDAPELRCILEEANKRSETALMVFVEDHIVLFKDFAPAILTVASRLQYFFAAGSSTSLSLTVDPLLPLSDWQKDVEAAIFYDSSVGRSSHNDQAEHLKHSDMAHQHSLHYFAYRRRHLYLTGLDANVVMGGSAFYGHQWEKVLVAHLLLQDNLTLVDLTDSVTAIELSHRDFSNLTTALNTYNSDRLERGSTLKTTVMSGVNESKSLSPPYYMQNTEDAKEEEHTGPVPIVPMNLGRLENSHYVLIGKCPTCSLKENREADLPLILIRHANAFGQIIVITVNSDYLALAFNWICRARAINMNNFVMLAEDRVAYRILRKMNIPVVLRKDAPYKKMAAAVGSLEFQETLYLRALFFKDVVSLGFDLILSHLDTIWFETSAELFENSVDTCDMWVQVESGTKAGGGLLFVRATPIGLQFVKDYLVCERENFEFITTHGKSRFFYSDDPAMNCVDLISQRLVRRNHLTRCTLDVTRYVSESVFFDQQLSQSNAIYPAFVHLNLQESVRNKTEAFLNWDLWQVDDLAMVRISTLKETHHHASIQCKAAPPALPLPQLISSSTSLRFIINILVSSENVALSQTLQHLASADYSLNSRASQQQHVQLDLRIYIQLPEHESSSANKQYMQVIALTQEFEWKFGSKTIIYINEYVGASDRWLDYWVYNSATSLSAASSSSTSNPTANEHDVDHVFQLALLAGQNLSPEWLTWCKKALMNYYYHPYQYDPQLMGIHLMHQFTIVGESPMRRFGSRLPSTVLNGTTQSLFHYQLVPLLGTLFFPRHFNTFLRWYSLQNQSHSFGVASKSACVPTLISNRWYREEPIKYWWTWLNRFSFESGWYLLYTNFQSITDSKPRALLIDETPLAGQLTVSLLQSLTSREVAMLPYSTIQLYDLHFNRFDLDRPMLALRKTHFPPMPSPRRDDKAALADLRLRQEALERERQRWNRERGKGGSDPKDGEPDARGLWERVRNERQTLDVGRLIVDMQADEHEAIGQQSLDSFDHSGLITTTELVVDLMKMVMTEADDFDAPPLAELAASNPTQPQPDGERYRDAIRSIRAKIKHVRAGEQHVHQHVRGSQRDRCYVIGDAYNTSDISSLNVIVDPISTLPYPYNASLCISELYAYIYRINMERLSVATALHSTSNVTARFIIYRPQVPVPFDRHLRGIYFTFLVALLTQRIFLVDLPDFEAMYDCPWPSTKWSYSAFSKYFVAKDKEDDAIKNPMMLEEISESKLKASLRVKFFDAIFPEAVLVHTDAISHDRLLFTNVQYKPYALSLFSTLSRMRRVGVLMKVLQAKPKNALIAAGKELYNSLGLHAVKYSLCVHVVAPPAKLVKLGSNEMALPGVETAHWQCVSSQLLSLGFKYADAVIFFTTNSPFQTSVSTAEAQIGRYGRVTFNPEVFDGNLTNFGIGNASMMASNRHDSLSGALKFDPYILGHFILGDCDISISSGTTYGMFGAARKGFARRAFLYKPKPDPIKNKEGKWVASEESDYCGPMHRIDYPPDNDIHF